MEELFMDIKKMTKWGAALFGFGVLVACGADSACTASTFSETNSGKPVVELGSIVHLDTSLVGRHEVEGDDCSELDSVIETSVLARKAAFGTDIVDEDSVIVWARYTCKAYYDIRLYIKMRVRIVDAKGKPLAGAVVYKKEYDEESQYTTDEEGYFYLDSVNYLTYYEKELNAAKELSPEEAYISRYESIQLRVQSADTSLGAKGWFNFSKAKVVKIDGEIVAELEEIVLEPLYSVKVSLDSVQDLALPLKNIKEVEFCAEIDDGVEEVVYYPNEFYRCQMLTKEEKENESVVAYGLPEGSYRFWVYELGWRLVNSEPIAVPQQKK